MPCTRKVRSLAANGYDQAAQSVSGQSSRHHSDTMTSTQKFTGHLTIDAGNPAVDIKVFDGSFQLLASGSGKIDETLPTGYYTVRYSAGDAREEKEITLRPDAPVVLDESPTL